MTSSIVTLPLIAPAKCFNCGGTGNKDGRKYVDTSLQIRLYGRVYICGYCFKELAVNFDLIDKDVYEEVAAVNFRLIEENNTLKVENGKLRDALASLDFIPERVLIDPLDAISGHENSSDNVGIGEESSTGPIESGTKPRSRNVRKPNSLAETLESFKSVH